MRLGTLEREFAQARTNAADVSRDGVRRLRIDVRSARKDFREAWRGWTRELPRDLDSLEPLRAT